MARQSDEPIWVRVACSLMHLALGGSVERRRRPRAPLVAALKGVNMLDVFRRPRLDPRSRRPKRGIEVREAITIKRPPEEVYRFWRELENLPRFLSHLESVTVDGARSRWKTRSIAGASVEWEVELTEDRPNERIAWRSVEGSDIEARGRVRFVRAPGDRGTEVHAELCYRPPLGKLGASAAKLLREAPDQRIKDDLYALKQLLETGEVVVSDATRERGKHPARPEPAAHAARHDEPHRQEPHHQERGQR